MQSYELRRQQRPRKLPRFEVGSPWRKSAQNVNENGILQSVGAESSQHTSRQRRTRLRRQLNLIEATSYKQKRLTPLSPIFKLLACGLGMTESNTLIGNAIASLDERLRQSCLEKSKNLTLEMVTDIGWMFEASKD